MRDKETTKPRTGQYIFRDWKVFDDQEWAGQIGVCFKETVARDYVPRWVWLRFDDGSEKAFSPDNLRPVE